MIVGRVTKTIQDLNQIPAEKGTSPTASISTLITVRARRDYIQVTKLNVVDYLQVYINKGKTNTNMACDVGTIALHLSGNEQGGWDVMFFSTGKIIQYYIQKKIIISGDVIDRVNQWVCMRDNCW